MLFEPYSLVSVAARSFLLLLLTAGIAIACRRCSAAVLHGIWTVGLGACLITPIVFLLSPSWAFPVLPAQEHSSAGVPVVSRFGEGHPPANAAHTPFRNEHPSAGHPLADTHHAVTTPPVPKAERMGAQVPIALPTNPARLPSLSSMAYFIWLTGLMVILFRLMHQTLTVHRKIVQANNFDDVQWHRLRDIAAQRLGLKQAKAV